MTHQVPRIFLMAVHGTVILGKPLQFRATALGLQVIPIAEVLPETYEKGQYYSIRSLAAVTSTSCSTIKRLIKSRRLKAHKIGKRTVIAYHDAMAYLAALRPVDSQIELGDDDDAGALVKVE